VSAPRRLLTVLTYHRIDARLAQPDLDPALISATPEEFERQVAWLAANTHPISLAELLDIRRARSRPPPRALLLTFDDAYCDFARHAWPVLRAHGLPATLFVATAYPGARQAAFWWDRLHRALTCTGRESIPSAAGLLRLATRADRLRAHRLLSAWVARTPHDRAMAEVERVVAEAGVSERGSPVLTWDELRRLRREGVALAPHSRTHPRLDRMDLTAAREEIAGSRRDVVRELGACPPAFAFPGGGHDERLRLALAEEGFELGFTTRRGSNDLGRQDWLTLRRANVGRASSLAVIRAQLLVLPARAALVGSRAA
jgi:peptidoglycan/xylan/chitin deacetylase (PgdA/CDA1 family)